MTGGEESDPSADGFADAFETEVAVRYTDVDTYGHVNNAVFATYLEEARIDYLEAVLAEADGGSSGGDGGDPAAELTAGGDEGVGMVVANLEIDYREPLELVDAVTVAVRVPRLGESSFPIEYRICERSGDRVFAEGETTMVAVDRGEGGARPLPDAWRAAIRAFEEG